MLTSEISWRLTEPLRHQVLGWPAGPVPGDLDAATVHLGVHLSVPAPDGHRAKLVGVVSMLAHPCPERPDQPACYFWAMAVQPERQGQGIGTALLRQVLVLAVAAGQSLVWADARLPALPFYERHGGQPVGPSTTNPLAGIATRRLLFELDQPELALPGSQG